jgi:asparagine synthase (glutamine-hydrolysing)
LPHFYDEPFADNSAVPTILVSRLAKKDVKVALSADGGDETFCGYNRYTGLSGVLKYLSMIDKVKSPLLSKTVECISCLAPHYSFWREKLEYLAQLLDTPRNQRIALTAEGGAFSTLTKSVYDQICPIAYPKSAFLLNQDDYHDPLSVAMAMDYINYMPNDILVKVDRAAMSVSLEGRDPLLDHRIVEFAARLPISYKFKDGQMKRIYKDILYQYVPRDMMERPKTGFMMPVDRWLQTDLRFLLEDYLNRDVLSDEYFRVEDVLKIKDLYFSDRLGHENKVIWRLLMFQMWYKENM